MYEKEEKKNNKKSISEECDDEFLKIGKNFTRLHVIPLGST
jgi:hypothetical protein